MNQTISIYTDGASSGNPGPGGYAAVITAGRHRQEVTGGFRLTTNNRMELFAAIAALETLQSRQKVRLFSDSQYLVESLNQGWVQIWKSKGWRKSRKEKVPNSDLWQRLLELLERQDVTVEWVEGHAGHPLNERANWLAQRALLAANLPSDEGYERASARDGTAQAGLFDALEEAPRESMSMSAPTLHKAFGSAPVDAPRSGRRAGQVCRKCGTELEKRIPARKVKPGQKYYYEYYLQCPNCKTIYLIEEARREL